MAQNDLNIANQSFPSFRTDLNNALSAIQTTHSGTSRPTGAVAGQIWLDTTTATSPTLKYYDGADDISLATIDHVGNTVNWLDSTVSITGLSTTATGTVLTLSDTNLNSTVSIRIPTTKGIDDDSGNEFIKFTKTATAVNEFTIINSATGVSPTISATGDDTNIGINLTTKGTGGVVLPAGAVATPALTTTGDLNTGIFFPSADTIAFTEGGTEAMRINSDGNVALAKNIGLGGATPTTSGFGITFPASQSASTDANTLDDYEEGTWTPTYVPSGTNFTSITYSSQNGRYTKIGRQVTVSAFIRTASITKGSASGNIKIESLPFAVGDGGASTGVVSGTSNWLGDYPLSGLASGSSIFLYYRDASDGGDFATNVGDIQTTADGNDTYITITYST